MRWAREETRFTHAERKTRQVRRVGRTRRKTCMDLCFPAWKADRGREKTDET